MYRSRTAYIFNVRLHLNHIHHMSFLHVVVIQCSRQLTVSILADAQSKLCNSNNIQFVISDETQSIRLKRLTNGILNCICTLYEHFECEMNAKKTT